MAGVEDICETLLFHLVPPTIGGEANTVDVALYIHGKDARAPIIGGTLSFV